MRPELRALCFLFLTCVLLAPVRASAEPRRPVDVIVPEAGDLQLLAFWTALGAGYFADEGLDVRPKFPEKPALAEKMFQAGAAPVALLPGPSFERLIEARAPFVLAANLLASDPLDLVVSHDWADRAHLSPGMPVRRRLELLHGASIGVTAQARPRLFLLFRKEGLDANLAHITLLDAGEELDAFGSGQVDALYTQTPVLERALRDKNAVMVVDATGGDVPAFSERMIQAVAVSRTFADHQPGDVKGLVRAVARGEHLLRFDERSAVDAIARVLPQSDRPHLSTLVSIYARGLPATPHVEVSLIQREASFYPVGGEPLKLAGIELAELVFDDEGAAGAGLEGAAPSRGSSPHRVLLLAAGLALAIALLAVLADQRDRSNELG